MTKTAIIILSLFLPGVLFAQESFVDYSDTYSILNMYSFLSVIIIGGITSIIVLVNARKMSGGIFGDALGYFGVGMLVMLAGITVSLGVAIFSKETIGIIGNMFYIIGYILMAIAADKIRGIIQGK